MSFAVTDQGGVFMVSLSGDFTLRTQSDFLNVLSRFDDSPSTSIKFDLGQVGFIDSGGLGMLLMAKEAAETSGGTITLKGATGAVERSLRMVNFDSLFKLEP